MLNGVLILNKPRGFTSHDAVSKLRGILKMRRIGHAGTLDPLAEGVLVMLLGSATRASECASGADKEYIAALRLGLTTDTQDITGEPVARRDASSVTRAQVEEALSRFAGGYDQLPPMYSAVQVNGARLYKLARQGMDVARDTRRVDFPHLELLPPQAGDAQDEYRVRVCCTKGAYIRTLCHDVGEALGCGACMTELTRVRAGSFTLAQALTFDEVARLRETDGLAPHIVPADALFSDLPTVVLNAEGAHRAVNGAPVFPRFLARGAMPEAGELCRVYAEDGSFLLLSRAGRAENDVPALLCYKLFARKDGEV